MLLTLPNGKIINWNGNLYQGTISGIKQYSAQQYVEEQLSQIQSKYSKVYVEQKTYDTNVLTYSLNYYNPNVSDKIYNNVASIDIPIVSASTKCIYTHMKVNYFVCTGTWNEDQPQPKNTTLRFTVGNVNPCIFNTPISFGKYQFPIQKENSYNSGILFSNVPEYIGFNSITGSSNIIYDNTYIARLLLSEIAIPSNNSGNMNIQAYFNITIYGLYFT